MMSEAAAQSPVKSTLSLPVGGETKPTLYGRFTNHLARLDQKWFLLPKLIYLFLNMAVYSTHTFTAMYFYEEWKLEIYQFGAVSSLSAVQFLGALFWGNVADRTGRHKTILVGSVIVYALIFGLLNLPVFRDPSDMLKRIIYTSCLYGLTCFFVANFFPLVDAQVFALLSRHPNFTKEMFGRQRLWGTIGHGLVTLMTASLIERFRYAGMFFSMFLSCGLFLVTVLLGIPSDVKVEKGLKKHHGHSSSSSENNGKEGSAAAATAVIQMPATNAPPKRPWLSLLMNGHFVFFLLVILMAGYVRAVMSYFLGFYMQKDMGRKPVLIAIAYLFRMGSEIAIFFFNKPLLNLFGVYWLLIIAQVAGILRVLGYAFLPPEGNWFYLSFAIELLKGTSTGCLVSAGVRVANDIAPPGCGNTAQAYFSGVYSGLAAALGGALGGLIIYLMPNHSVAGMFRVTFVISSACLVLQVLKYSLIDRVILVPARWRRQAQLGNANAHLGHAQLGHANGMATAGTSNGANAAA